MRHEIPSLHLQERGVDEEGSSREEAAAQSLRSADQHREGGDDADGASHQAAGTAASEGSSSGVEWDETSGLPESEHAGGDDAGDEETEGGDGGSGERAGGEQPLLREIRHVDAGRRFEGLKTSTESETSEGFWLVVHILCLSCKYCQNVRWSFLYDSVSWTC